MPVIHVTLCGPAIGRTLHSGRKKYARDIDVTRNAKEEAYIWRPSHLKPSFHPRISYHKIKTLLKDPTLLYPSTPIIQRHIRSNFHKLLWVLPKQLALSLGNHLSLDLLIDTTFSSINGSAIHQLKWFGDQPRAQLDNHRQQAIHRFANLPPEGKQPTEGALRAPHVGSQLHQKLDQRLLFFLYLEMTIITYRK